MATGQAHRADAIHQAIVSWRNFYPAPYNSAQGIQLGALVCLVDVDDRQQQLFIGPEGGNMTLGSGADLIRVISSKAPLARAVLGKSEGDEVELQVGAWKQQFEVLKVC